jgi:hypothetical protein
MKLKQVTFAEALEHMQAGGYAYPTSSGDHTYRVSQNEIQHRHGAEAWYRSGNALQCAMEPWFIEVEPMRDTYDTQVRADGFLPGLSYGPQWFGMRVRVTVEEI